MQTSLELVMVLCSILSGWGFKDYPMKKRGRMTCISVAKAQEDPQVSLAQQKLSEFDTERVQKLVVPF